MHRLNREVTMGTVLSHYVKLPAYMRENLDQDTQRFVREAWREYDHTDETLYLLSDRKWNDLAYLLLVLLQPIALWAAHADQEHGQLIFWTLQKGTILLYGLRLLHVLGRWWLWRQAFQDSYSMSEFLLDPSRALDAAPVSRIQWCTRLFWVPTLVLMLGSHGALSAAYLVTGLILIFLASEARILYPILLETIRIQ